MNQESPLIYLNRVRRNTAYPFLRNKADLFSKIGFGIGIVFIIFWFMAILQGIGTILDRNSPDGFSDQGTGMLDMLLGVFLGAGFIGLWFLVIYIGKQFITLLCDLVDSQLEANRKKGSEPVAGGDATR